MTNRWIPIVGIVLWALLASQHFFYAVGRGAAQRAIGGPAYDITDTIRRRASQRDRTKGILYQSDDAPIITREIAERGEWRAGGKVIRNATGTWTKPGRPPVGEEAKKQVTLRLDADLVAFFRDGGAGWQTRLNAMLRKAAGI